MLDEVIMESSNNVSQRIFDNFELASEDLCIEVITEAKLKSLPPDTCFHTVAETIRFYFVVELSYINGSYESLVVTSEVLRKWNVTKEEVLNTTLAGAVGTHPANWSCQGGFLSRVYEFSLYSRGWIPEFLSPSIILQLTIRGAPVAVIPDEDSVMVTGHRDWLGIRKLARVCKSVPTPDGPITRRPLLYDVEAKQWVVLPAYGS